MNRRLAWSLASCAVVVLTAGSASAWETRVLTLGDQNRFIEDDANIWLYPQKTMQYGDRLYLDLARKEGGVIDSDGESEGLDAIKSLNGGFFLDMTDSFHMAFWASQYSDRSTYTFLTGAQAAQTDLPTCGKIVSEDTTVPSNNCRLSSETNVTADAFRQGYDFAKGADRKFDVFAGLRVTPSFDLGAQMWFGTSSFTHYDEQTISADDGVEDSGNSESVNRAFSTSNFGLGLGASIEMFQDTSLDVGLRYGHYMYDMDDDGVKKPEFDGGDKIDVDTRMRMRLSKAWWLVPSIQFDYTHFGGFISKQTSPGGSSGLGDKQTEIKWDRVNFDLGLGLQMQVVNKANLFTAIGLDYQQDVFDAYSNWAAGRTLTFAQLQLPYWRTGFEAPLFTWLDWRAGFEKRWGTWRYTDEYSDQGDVGADLDQEEYRRSAYWVNESEYSIDDESAAGIAAQKGYFDVPGGFDTFVGATIHHEGWYLTTEVDPNFLFHGPFNSLGTGADTTDRPWFARMDLSYRF